MSLDPTAITFECDLTAPPRAVWKALTVPELLAAWLLPNDIRPEPGARFHFELPEGQSAPHGSVESASAGERAAPGGRIECQVLAADPHRLLCYSWRSADDERDDAGQPLDTVVTFELIALISGGTRLRLTHSGFPVSLTGPLMALASATALPRVGTRPQWPYLPVAA